MRRLQPARVAWAKAHLRPAPAAVTDRSPWDWYAESCPCGLPPGECRAHPRARMSQRPPEGDWRGWAYVGGRGAGKTWAGACWVQQRAQAAGIKPACPVPPPPPRDRDALVEDT